MARTDGQRPRQVEGGSRPAKAAARYDRRGKAVSLKQVGDKKLKAQLRKAEYVNTKTAERAAAAEAMLAPHESGALEAEGAMERTFKFKQADVSGAVDRASARKIFSLAMAHGPYRARYSRNGVHLLLGGKKGHVALCEWQTGKLLSEMQLDETVRDVAILQNQTLFAVAQKKYVHMYDQAGVEIHCLRSHVEPSRLEYLPYHFLLASVGHTGWLKYQDISTGDVVSELRTRAGACDCMRQNERNAVIHLGHANGVVSLWAPSMSKPLVKVLCHRGAVQQLAVDTMGQYMATSGLDGYVKVWDLRTYKMLHAYTTFRPAQGLDISQSGMLAVGHGSHVQVWKDALQSKQKSPYMSHELPSKAVSDVRFCPFEDALGLCSSAGFDSIVVPGAGSANYDSFENNPFESKKQRQETEVKRLLEKLKPEMINLQPDFIGGVERHSETIEEGRKAAKKAASESHAPRGIVRTKEVTRMLDKKTRKSGGKAGEEGEDEEAQEGDGKEELPSGSESDGDGSGGEADAGKPEAAKAKQREKRRQRGRSTAAKRFKKKQANVHDVARQKYLDERAKEKADREKVEQPFSALNRFG